MCFNGRSECRHSWGSSSLADRGGLLPLEMEMPQAARASDVELIRHALFTSRVGFDNFLPFSAARTDG